MTKGGLLKELEDRVIEESNNLDDSEIKNLFASFRIGLEKVLPDCGVCKYADKDFDYPLCFQCRHRRKILGMEEKNGLSNAKKVQ